jgi:hypothetical protein
LYGFVIAAGPGDAKLRISRLRGKIEQEQVFISTKADDLVLRRHQGRIARFHVQMCAHHLLAHRQLGKIGTGLEDDGKPGTDDIAICGHQNLERREFPALWREPSRWRCRDSCLCWANAAAEGGV